jgi:hypothetical protein|tara:strand:+ start:269 stop:487 length:219 start_codon:yes stop_codon:yes gene_type:complete
MARDGRIQIKTFLKTVSQKQLGRVFGRSQGWVSQIQKEHPEARLEIVGGEVKKITFSVKKEHVAIDSQFIEE